MRSTFINYQTESLMRACSIISLRLGPYTQRALALIQFRGVPVADMMKSMADILCNQVIKNAVLLVTHWAEQHSLF